MAQSEGKKGVPETSVKKSETALREEAILKFWQDNDIFKKSEAKEAPNGEYVFYDGPPFATGLPHYGHLLAGTIKDVIPRYQTMRGHRVIRKWGWDCHGLPLENQIEDELGIKNKREIEEVGIEKFNTAAKNAVLRYADDWRRIVPRMGRWVDMTDDYKTMDATYMESVWWVFKTLYDKGLIYEGFKSMHLCPRCGTTLSNFEVAQGYQDIKDISVFIKLELKDEPGTYMLAWTTTPWTLPGNMAAAVHKDEDYVKVEIGGDKLIVAKARLEALGTDSYKIIEELPGKSLVGKKYSPPFDYYLDKDLKGKENAWKVYHAPYVSTEDGTGIVHLAPAFGAEDMELAQEYGVPLVHHVNQNGAFTEDVVDFAGQLVKPKDDKKAGVDHTDADVEIIKHMAKSGVLFRKEKITHSYPHCWRCDTPLLNYAASSWFVNVQKIKQDVLKENSEVHWVPDYVGKLRFGNWIENAPDWAISRARYWGAPLPVWKNEKTGECTVIGSVEDVKKHTLRSGNQYYAMRHGESENNVQQILNSDPDVPYPLTEKGVEQVQASTKEAKKAGIDLVIHSPMIRAKESAEIIAKELALDQKDVICDERITEIGMGDLEGKPYGEWRVVEDEAGHCSRIIPGGESWLDQRKRVSEILYEIENTYKNRNVLFVSHDSPLSELICSAKGLDSKTCAELAKSTKHDLKNGELVSVEFTPLPHNRDYDLDLHRPYIDEHRLVDEEGNELTRIPDVFDCWFESGSMPYAQQHHPFEKLDYFNPDKGKGFPAHFIAESIDQTRGWFYSLIILGVALFGKSPYQNVITNGLVLAEDGRKMSKKLKNYPDPIYLADTYGADAMRFYLMSSSLMKGEDLNFSEKIVGEISRKNISRLQNVLSFYELYRDIVPAEGSDASNNVLDRWILSRLAEVVEAVTKGMENYELDRASRPITGFIDDLSTWYIRRSRDRFKGGNEADKKLALSTTKFVLDALSRISAPFTPFFSEHLYRQLHQAKNDESVHLSEWPEAGNVDEELIADMQEVRDTITLALEARDAAGIKVRQPLQSLTITSARIAKNAEYAQIIADEVNVKKVPFGKEFALDTTITPELKEEGDVREFIRQIQQLRKKLDFNPHDTAILTVDIDQEVQNIVKKHQATIKGVAGLSEIAFKTVSAGESIVFAEATGSISITR